MSDEKFYNPHDSRHVGEKLRRCREAAKMSRKDLAQKIGLKGHDNIEWWEKGHITPQIRFRKRMNTLFEEEIFVGVGFCDKKALQILQKNFEAKQNPDPNEDKPDQNFGPYLLGEQLKKFVTEIVEKIIDKKIQEALASRKEQDV